MPSYDYHCATNGRTVEVRHSMSESLNTWAEVCARAGVDLGDTPGESPVERLISGGQFISSSALGNPEAPACATGGCPGGVCGLG